MIIGCQSCIIGFAPKYVVYGVAVSKLADSLSRLSRASPVPMGFRATSAPRPAPMLLLGQLPHVSKELVEAVKAGNLDAVIVETGAQGTDSQSLSKLSKALTSTPWGVFWDSGSVENAASLAKAGADFVIADSASAPAAILDEKRLGHVLVVDKGLADGMVIAVDSLGVNAVLLKPGFVEASFLTIGDVLACQRVSRLVRKPVLVTVSLDLKAADLQALVGVGGKGVVVRLPDREAVRRAAEMKSVLGTLSAAKREAGGAIVPSVAPEPSHDEGEEEP